MPETSDKTVQNLSMRLFYIQGLFRVPAAICHGEDDQNRSTEEARQLSQCLNNAFFLFENGDQALLFTIGFRT